VKILKYGFKYLANVPVGLYVPEPHVSFVDMVSNCLANCYTSLDNNIGFLFLCEVALGEVMVYQAQQPDDKAK